MSRRPSRPEFHLRTLAIFILLLFHPAAATDPRSLQGSTDRPGDPPAREEPAGAELEDFVPSEEIRADSAISFPVDI